MPDAVNFVDQHSTADAKIKLFRSLFRGRDDVYPRRFESRKTGRAGYAPACGNEWIRGICEKPRIKCAECRHQRFLPIRSDPSQRRGRLSETLLDACGKQTGGQELLIDAHTCEPDERLDKIIDHLLGRPVLVVRSTNLSRCWALGLCFRVWVS